MSKQVLFISYDGMTDPLGQSQVLPYLAALSKRGYIVHLISFEKRDKFEKLKSSIESICAGAGIRWQPALYTKSPPILGTLYDLWKMNKMARALIKQHHIDAVHCRSYIAALIGLGCKRGMGTKFIFDMRGFWADERVEGNIWNLHNPIFRAVYSFFKRKEIQYFTEADYTISLTHTGKSEIHSWKSIRNNPIPIQVIPCCVDIEKFSHPAPLQEDSMVQKAKREGRFILGYIGSIGTWYMLEEMLDFFKELKKQKKESLFLFVTQEQALVRAWCRKKQIDDNDICLTTCLHAEVPDYIAVLDAAIFFIKPSFSKKASSPTKQGEIMALGKPIFCNAGVGDTDKVIEKYHAGQIIEEFSPQAYKKAIETFCVTSYNTEEIKKGASEFYSLSNGVNLYEEVYKKTME